MHRFWIEVAEWIHQQLRTHDTFIKLLGSIHFSDTKLSNLAFLDIDKQTSEALTKMIAKFAGVPTDKELGKLRRALANLESKGYSGRRSV